MQNEMGRLFRTELVIDGGTMDQADQKEKASDRFTVLAFYGSLCWARTSDPLINSQML